MNLVVLKVPARLPVVGEVEFGLSLSLSSKLFGAVKMDWETFIEPAAKALGPLDRDHKASGEGYTTMDVRYSEGRAHNLQMVTTVKVQIAKRNERYYENSEICSWWKRA